MPQLFALLGAVAISFSAIFVRLADVAPATAAFFRSGYALPVLLIAWWFTREGDTRSRQNRVWTVLAGLLMGGSLLAWNYAIPLIGAGLSTVIGNTQVVFVGIAAWLIFGERPSRAAAVAVPVVFAGVLLSTGLGGAAAYGEAPVVGAAIAFANALVYATFLLTFRRLVRDVSLPTGAQLDATIGAAALPLVVGPLTDPAFSLVPAWPEHGWLALLALGSQVIGWFCILVALPRLPALQTSIILLLQPALAVLWGYLIFAEVLSTVQWLGVGAVLAGVGMLSVASARARRRERRA